jgi:beta-glucosidase/6-phospho-beta-glucosidase/beta-galactosidase
MGKKFPDGFLWGTAISSFQVEMGLGDPSDKTDWWVWVNDHDNFVNKIVSGDTPLEGPGFWELYPEDFRLLREGLCNNAVRLSIDWGRLFPCSTEDIEVSVKYDDEGCPFEVEITESVLAELDNRVTKSAVKRYQDIFS